MKSLKNYINNKLYFENYLTLINENFSAFPRRGLAEFEGYALYCFIRAYKPKKIYEMSPDMGWSTFIICSAILAEGYENEIETYKLFDLTNKLVPHTNNLLSKIPKNDFITGDASFTLNFEDGPIDFWFIDSNHSKSFAEWYIKLIENTTYFFVHDIDPAKDYHNKFRQNDSCVHAGGEPLVVYDYLFEKGFTITEETLFYDTWNNSQELGEYHSYWTHKDQNMIDKTFWSFTEQIVFNKNNTEFPNTNNRSLFFCTK